MDAKISIFSELSNILSIKGSLRTNLMAHFIRLGIVIHLAGAGVRKSITHYRKR